ncbi:hypothetical protein [Halostella sp. PRR32]|uniref:hypothetical protein n=1 Tax=Halostella sp. PRR32 TaxID=3098147 RepID=UPI002B1D781A|nr:hypothetical protein [Halostella sp. PRR32]
MTFQHRLQYAGSDPYQPERDREDLTHREREQLEQDETYQRLAEVRWLADELEREVAGNAEIAEETRANLFRAVATDDAPLQDAVEEYVDAWVAEYRNAEGDDE